MKGDFPEKDLFPYSYEGRTIEEEDYPSRYEIGFIKKHDFDSFFKEKDEYVQIMHLMSTDNQLEWKATICDFLDTLCKNEWTQGIIEKRELICAAIFIPPKKRGRLGWISNQIQCPQSLEHGIPLFMISEKIDDINNRKLTVVRRILDNMWRMFGENNLSLARKRLDELHESLIAITPEEFFRDFENTWTQINKCKAICRKDDARVREMEERLRNIRDHFISKLNVQTQEASKRTQKKQLCLSVIIVIALCLQVFLAFQQYELSKEVSIETLPDLNYQVDIIEAFWLDGSTRTLVVTVSNPRHTISNCKVEIEGDRIIVINEQSKKKEISGLGSESYIFDLKVDMRSCDFSDPAKHLGFNILFYLRVYDLDRGVIVGEEKHVYQLEYLGEYATPRYVFVLREIKRG